MAAFPATPTYPLVLVSYSILKIYLFQLTGLIRVAIYSCGYTKLKHHVVVVKKGKNDLQTQSLFAFISNVVVVGFL